MTAGNPAAPAPAAAPVTAAPPAAAAAAAAAAPAEWIERQSHYSCDGLIAFECSMREPNTPYARTQIGNEWSRVHTTVTRAQL